MGSRLARVLGRLSIAAAMAAVLYVVPLRASTPRWVVYFQVPAVTFLVVCYTGKLLIDTLFYSRYP